MSKHKRRPPTVTSVPDREFLSNRTIRVAGTSAEFGPYEFELTLGYASDPTTGPVGRGPIFIALDNEVIPAIRKALKGGHVKTDEQFRADNRKAAVEAQERRTAAVEAQRARKDGAS